MKNRVLTKDNTKMLQGIAILMMVYHHLFISGNNWVVNEGTSILNIFNFINIGQGATMQLTFSYFCKMCVAIFAFTSGYGMFIQYENRCEDKINIKEMYKYCLKRFLSFYKIFLFCFLFFNVIQILIGNPSDFDYSLKTFIINALGLGVDYNSTLWYIPIYYCMIFISPLVYLFLKKVDLKKFIIFLVCIFIISSCIAFVFFDLVLFLKAISQFIQYYQTIFLLIFMEGMFCGRYKLIKTIYSYLNLFTALIMLVVVFIARSLLIRAPSDSIFDLVFTLPFVIAITKLLDKTKIIKPILCFFGKYSAYIWYSHPYFYAYLFYGLVIRTDLSLLVYIQVLAYSTAISIIFAKIVDLLEKPINKLLLNK